MMTRAAIPRAWIDGEACQVPALGVHELFLTQAHQAPGALAVRQWDEFLSYRQLAGSASALAGQLVAAGAGPGSRVGICMRRIPWLPASELAVLMAGAAFVPLDPDQPAERLRIICEDAGIDTALVDNCGAELLSGIIGRLNVVGTRQAAAHAAAYADAGGRAQVVAPRDPAYVMYTSGSTGQPKGVVVSHENLTAFACAANQYLGRLSAYRMAALAAIGYDVSIFELFTPLMCGGSIHLVPEPERIDPERLQRFLHAHSATRAILPPVLLPLLHPGRLPGLRDLIVGGEPCDPGQVSRWTVTGQRRFINMYGPTETTIAVTGAELTGQWDRPLPIGRPLPGSSVYILDGDMRLCPPGRAGELVIGGPQVALGYLANAREVTERFVPDPFRDGASRPGDSAVLYRTGDLAEWDETGVISFLGRADRQVQIHGRRVEPAEIETVLAGHPRVTQAVVDVFEGTIRAYVTPVGVPSSEELRGYCSAWLPPHMIPASVTGLAQLPTTTNAKVDFRTLRRLYPATRIQPASAGGAGSEFEVAVARNWAALLGVPTPCRDDDFFLAGGDSLSAIRLASALQASTGRQISAQDIFSGRTVSRVAARIGSADALADAVPQAGLAVALSPAQRRLWFVEQFAPGIPVHNIVLAEAVSGVFDVPVLKHAFEQVITRQAALRWELRPSDGLPDVAVADPAPVAISISDFSALDAQAGRSALAAVLDEETGMPIDLTAGPLYRIRLVHLGDSEHVLIFTVHHIVFDGWSHAILYRELGQAYTRLLADRAATCPPPDRVTFADYTSQVLDQAGRIGTSDADWWGGHLRGAPTALDLPADRPRPAVLSFNGAVRGAPVKAELVAEVTQLARSEGTTASAVLLATFGILLRRLTGERDLVVGMPMADREQVGFADVIGFFVRTMPLRLRIDDHVAFTEHVQRCGDELVSARLHADAPLERIVEELGGDRDLSRNQLFQVMFNIYDFSVPCLELDGTTTRRVHAGVPGSLVDLTLYVIIGDRGMRLEAAYNSDLFDSPRIDALLDSYVQLLSDLVRDPAQSVAAASARSGRVTLPDWTSPLLAAIPHTPGLLEQVRATGGDTPDSVAVQDGSRTLSYGEVLRICDTTAAALRAAAVVPGDVVAVLVERTAILPGLLLGVLSTGARWAVLDSELPDEVLDHHLTAVQPRALIRGTPNAPVTSAGWATPVIDVASLVSGAVAAPAADVPVATRGYLSLTSGTTGTPKVIDVGEAPLMHFLNWYRTTFGLRSDARFAMLSGVAHDPLLRDIFTPLTCGGRLSVPDADLIREPSRLVAWLDHLEITVAHLTPQLVRMMATGSDRPGALESLRLVALAGDQLTEGDVGALRLMAPRARLLNFYGTTETPQAQAYYEIPPPRGCPERGARSGSSTRPVPVGAGIDGAQLLVMGVGGRPAAVGELGEVVIRSRHLSNGYLGDRLSGERFSPLPGAGEGRVFRTGDLGRYEASGAVTLAGRADDQVKVRGFRVELWEVEAALCSHPHVRQAAVRLFERDGASALHAYVVGRGSVLTESDILRHARSRLPSHAVPSGISLLSTLPLTQAAKVDRAMLPPPGRDIAVSAAPGRQPEGYLERQILGIWRDVLGRPRIGSDDNFFEIGGHSMALIEVQARLRRLLGLEVLVVDLFRFPTIRSLAVHLVGGEADTDLLDAAVRGRMRSQRAGRRRAHRREGGMNT